MMEIYALYTDGDLFDVKSINSAIARTKPDMFNIAIGSLSYFVNPVDFTNEEERFENSLSNHTGNVDHRRLILDEYRCQDFVLNLGHYAPEDLRKIFNIVDLIFYSKTKDETLLNTELLRHSDKYSVYVPSTVNVCFDDWTVTIQNESFDVPEWISFDVQLLNSNTNITDVVKFKIWSNSRPESDFMIGYPHTKIFDIIDTIDLNRLLTEPITGPTVNEITSIAHSYISFGNKLDLTMPNEAISNIFIEPFTVFDTSNNPINSGQADSSNRSKVVFPFPYKGPRPTLIDARKHSKQYVLSSGVGTEEQWRRRIPELFVENKFYIIPAWDSFWMAPDNTREPRSSFDVSEMLDRSEVILSHLDMDHIRKEMSSVSVSFDGIISAFIKDDSNISPNDFDDEHPTYKHVRSDLPEFNKMAVETQEFAISLNEAIENADHSSIQANNPGQIRREFNKDYVTFVSKKTEYYVLSRWSYEALFPSN